MQQTQLSSSSLMYTWRPPCAGYRSSTKVQKLDGQAGKRLLDVALVDARLVLRRGAGSAYFLSMHAVGRVQRLGERHQPECRLRAGRLLAPPRPARHDRVLGAGRLLLITPRVAQKGGHLSHRSVEASAPAVPKSSAASGKPNTSCWMTPMQGPTPTADQHTRSSRLQHTPMGRTPQSGRPPRHFLLTCFRRVLR